MSFKFVRHLLGAASPQSERLTIGNSQTISVGDAVTMSGGYVQPAVANGRIYGICVGLEDANGLPLVDSSADYDGVFTEVNTGDTYVSASDNVTDKKVKAVVVADPYAVFENVADGSMALATLKQFFSLVDADQVDASENSATVGEVQLYALPDGAGTKGHFRIVAWQGDAFEPETA